MKSIDRKDIIFITERLIVRKLTFEDSDCFFDMQGNPNVMCSMSKSIWIKVKVIKS